MSQYAYAPSNIALIKYMGKKDAQSNLPANRSLSLTLNHLRTCARASEMDAPMGTLKWVEDEAAPEGFCAPKLKAEGILKLERYLNTLTLLLPEALQTAGFEVDARPLVLSSWNNFPAEAGIASSASAFAALTGAVALSWVRDSQAFLNAWSEPSFRKPFASLSRRGSGSSIRSFLGPWVMWDGERPESVECATEEWDDTILLIRSEPKAVSSSVAHQRVLTSPLWMGRVERVEERMENFLGALRSGDWGTCARLSWQEAWEMHSLFHTAWPSFSYMTGQTLEVLKTLSAPLSDGALWCVTLDAGPNIHIVTPKSETEGLRTYLNRVFPDIKRLEDQTSTGVSLSGK